MSTDYICSPKHSPSWHHSQKAPGPSGWKVQGDQPLSYADPDFGEVDLLLTNVTGQVASGFGEGRDRLQVGLGEITLHASQLLQARNLSFKPKVTPFPFFFFFSLFVPSGLWKHELHCFTATSLNSIWEINSLLKNSQDLDCHQETH